MENQIPEQVDLGLLSTPKDRRDFRLGQIIDWPDLSELPESFELPPLSIKSQGQTDFCTGFATCGMSELQEGVELNPYWSFAASQILHPTPWGQDIRTAMKTHVKFGAVENEGWERLPGYNKEFLANITNYPERLFKEAKEHKKQSFFEVSGYPMGWTPSDAVKAALWLFRAKKRAVGIGVVWSWRKTDKKMTAWSSTGKGHMMYVRGWNKDGYLIVQNSFGRLAGDRGHHYFSPVVIDRAVDRFKAFVFVDISPEEAKKVCWSIFRRIWEWFKKLLK